MVSGYGRWYCNAAWATKRQRFRYSCEKQVVSRLREEENRRPALLGRVPSLPSTSRALQGGDHNLKP